jgi:hypothetical protein
MPEERVVVREVAWLEIFPWLILLRTFRIAAQPKLLVVAAAGALLTWLGFWSIGYVFSGTKDDALGRQIEAATTSPLEWISPEPVTTARSDVPASDNVVQPPAEVTATADTAPPFLPPELSAAEAQQTMMGWTLGDVPIYGPWERLSRPYYSLFKSDLSITGFAFHFLCALWVAMVWTFCGGLICRTAAMQLAAEEKISLGRAMRHVQAKWLAYFLGPVGTLLAFLVIALAVGAAGFILRAEVGLLIGAILWPIVLGLGTLGTLILAGVFFGWPLMWAAVGVEHSDHYDALSRSFTYVLSRPLHFLFYLFVTAVIGTLGWLAAAAFAETVIYLSAWAACRGAQPELFEQIMAVVPHPWPGPGADWPAVDLSNVDGPAWAGLQVIRFWSSLVHLLVVGFVFSYFWTAACGCYLLLRYHVDGNELDDIVLDDDDEPHKLPPLGTDSQGVPTAPSDGAEAESDE